MLWLNDNRAKIADEFFADLTGKERVTKTAKKAGELWKELSDDEKAPYNEQSAAARAEYQKLKAAYVPPEDLSLLSPHDLLPSSALMTSPTLLTDGLVLSR